MSDEGIVKFLVDDTITAEQMRDGAVDALRHYRDFADEYGETTWMREREAMYIAWIRAAELYIKQRREVR